MEDRKIDLKSIVSDIKNNFMIIILISVVIMLCAHLLLSMFHRPKYETTLSYVVSSTESSNENSTSNKKLVNIFKEVIESNILDKNIRSNMGYGDHLPAEISSEIIINNSGETVQYSNIIIVTVTSNSPRNSFDVACAIQDNCINVSDYINQNSVLTLLDKPSYPEIDSKKINFVFVDIAAFLFSMILITSIITYLSILRDTIKNSEEIREKLNVTMLATIPNVSLKLSRKKAKERKILITDDTAGFYYIENIKKIRSKIQHAKKDDKGMCVAIASVLPSEGRTTVAVNLALSLSMQHRVLLIDMDFKKPSIFKMLPDYNIVYEFTDFLNGKTSAFETIATNEKSNLNVLFQCNKVDNSSEILSSKNMKVFLEYAKEHFDYIIIDTTPISITADVEIISGIIDNIALVVKQDAAKTEDINSVLDMIERNKCNMLGCIYNNDSRSSKDNYYGNNYGYGNYNYYIQKSVKPVDNSHQIKKDGETLAK